MTEPAPSEEPRLDLRRIRHGMLIAVFIGLFAGIALVSLARGADVLAQIAKLPPLALAFAAALVVTSWVLQGLSMLALVPERRSHLLRQLVRALLGGEFPALVTPFGSAGIPAGIYCLTQEGFAAGEATAIITLHSLVSTTFFVLAAIVAALTLPLQTTGSGAIAWTSVTFLAIGGAGFLYVALRPHSAAALLHRVLAARWVHRALGGARAARFAGAVEREADRFGADVRLLLRERPVSVLLCFAGVTAGRIALVASLPVIMYGLGWRGQPWLLIAIALGALALGIVSPTPGGSGAVEAALTALLATQSDIATAAAAALVWRGITYYGTMATGAIVLSWYVARGRALRDAAAAEAASPRAD